MFPKGYLKYDGIENKVGNDGECYIHCSKIEGCELEMVEDFSVLGNGAVQLEYFSPVFGSYIDFYVDNVKITLEYYMDGMDFIYDIKVYDENENLIAVYNALNMTKTKLKIEWFGGNTIKIYLYNDYVWGEIIDVNVNYTVGKWKMTIKGVIEIYNLAIYRRWI